MYIGESVVAISMPSVGFAWTRKKELFGLVRSMRA